MTNEIKAIYSTLGCKVNAYDTECIKNALKNKGIAAAEKNETADVVFINTCCVTNESERKAKQLIRKEKKLNPTAVIVVAGCYARVKPEEIKAETGADIVTGEKDPDEIAQLVISALFEKNISTENTNITEDDRFIADFSDKTRASVKIQDGCNMFCSYCIIPYARGRSVSAKVDDLVDQINKITSNGYSEAVLTGIHIASYSDGSTKLIDLMERIDSETALERLRLGSVEPRLLTEDFLKRAARLRSFCPHFHISLQSGSNKILKAMNRKYTAEEYLAICGNVRKYLPDACITTDVIVGFPSETEEDFLQTAELCRKVGFSHIHVFPFAPKDQTPAKAMKEQLPGSVKHERATRLIAVGEELTRKCFAGTLGKKHSVLFEKRNKDGLWEGYSKNYLPFLLDCKRDISGRIIDVVAESCDDGGIISLEIDK